jgi:MoaD family protein
MSIAHVKILFHAQFREVAGKKEVVEEVKPNHTLADILTKLARQYGKDFNTVLDNKTGQINTDTLVMINGQSTRKTDTKLKDNDTIMITIPIGGG